LISLDGEADLEEKVSGHRTAKDAKSEEGDILSHASSSLFTLLFANASQEKPTKESRRLLAQAFFCTGFG